VVQEGIVITFDDLGLVAIDVASRQATVPPRIAQLDGKLVRLHGEYATVANGRVVLAPPRSRIVGPPNAVICNVAPTAAWTQNVGTVTGILRLRPQWQDDGCLISIYELDDCRFSQ
jgi:hypothetical protein